MAGRRLRRSTIAPNYQDWHASVPRQGRVLDTLIRARLPGTDLSPGSIHRARQEAASVGVEIGFAVVDMRHLTSSIPTGFDVVISCDNSLPHLQTDADLDLALAGMASRLRPGGLLGVGIGDYDTLVRDRPRFTPPQVVERPDHRSVLFQLWDWAENRASYEVTMFVSKQDESDWKTEVHRVTYRALRRHELESHARQVGFTVVEGHEPAETGHHQPLMTATLPPVEGIA